MPKYMQCLQWDEATQTCVSSAWVDQLSVFPPLTVEQGLEVSGAIVLLWGIAFGLRTVARFIWRG